MSHTSVWAIMEHDKHQTGNLPYRNIKLSSVRSHPIMNIPSSNQQANIYISIYCRNFSRCSFHKRLVNKIWGNHRESLIPNLFHQAKKPLSTTSQQWCVSRPVVSPQDYSLWVVEPCLHPKPQNISIHWGEMKNETFGISVFLYIYISQL